MDDDEEFYINLVGQIIDGFSEFTWGGRYFYVKHHNFREQASIPTNFEKFKKEAIDRGVPTEEEAIQEAIQRGDWSEADENFVKEQSQKIEALTKAAEKMKIPSMKEGQLKMVQGIKEEVAAKKEDRESLLEHTAESISYQKTNNRFMEMILFKDADLKTPLVAGEDCSEEEFYTIRNKQTESYNQFTDDSISKAVLMDFFGGFMQFTENPLEFFGKPIVKLTVFQLKLLTYSKLFSHIFKNFQDIPDLIKKDPSAILQYVSSKNAANASPKPFGEKRRVSDKAATTYFGANKEDLQKMKEKDERIVSLSDEVKKHGGQMNMEQMMKMMGED